MVLFPLVVSAADIDRLLEVSDLIVAEARDSSSITKIKALGEEIQEVADYAGWLNTKSVDKLRKNTISALNGICVYAGTTIGYESPEVICLRLNMIVEKGKVINAEDEFDLIVDDSNELVKVDKSDYARSVNLLARIMRFRYHHTLNTDYSPSNYLELIDLEKEVLDLFSPESDEATRIRIEIYSCFAEIVSYPINHVMDNSIALRLADKDCNIEKRAHTTSYLMGQDYDYWSNALWYYEKAEKLSMSLYSEEDIRYVSAKYNRLNDAISTLGYREELLSELNQCTSFFETNYTITSPTYIYTRINQWLNDIILGKHPS